MYCSICFVLSDTTNSEISCCYISIWMVFFSSLPLLIINHITILQVKTQHSIFLDAKAPVLSVSQSVGWSHFLKSRVWRSNSIFIMIQIFIQESVKSHPRVSQESSKSHPRIIQESPKSHPRVIQESSKSNPRVIQESSKSRLELSKSCPRVIQESSKSHPRVIQESTKSQSRFI